MHLTTTNTYGNKVSPNNNDNQLLSGVTSPVWKPALNAFAITFADRMPAAEDR